MAAMQAWCARHVAEQNLKRKVGRYAAALGFIVLMFPGPINAQKIEESNSEHGERGQHHRYKLVDIGTFGGPNSVLNGPSTIDVNNQGIYAGQAETGTPDPNAPNCQNPECLIYHAQKWQDGKAFDLGSLPGINDSGASCVNDRGIIIGGSQNGAIDPFTGLPEDHAVVWSKDGRIFDLGTLDGGTHSFASFINNRNEIIGSYSNTTPDPYSMQFAGYQTHAFLWRDGKKADLGTLGGPDAFPQILNDRGQIAGASYTDNLPNSTTGVPTQAPFIWENGEMRSLGTLGGRFGYANWINSRGQVVGSSNLTGDTISHAFIWEHGTMRDMGTLGGSTAEVFKITDEGEAVGISDFQGDMVHHGFRWKNGALTDLKPVAGDFCTNAYGINGHGQIVGTSTNCQGVVQHLFLWEDGNIADLSTLLLPGPTIDFKDVYDINDRGEIAAAGLVANGDYHAVLLIPCDQAHSNVEGCKGHVDEMVDVGDPSNAATQSEAQISNPASPATRVVRERKGRGYHVQGRPSRGKPQ